MKKVATLIIWIMCTANVSAQSESPVRKGFTIGGSAGVGVMHFTQGMEGSVTQGDINLPNLKIGWFAKENLAFYLNAPGQIYEVGGRDRSFEGLIPSVQYWTSDRWWISGGFGAALDMRTFYESRKHSGKTNLGKGVLLSTGYEFKQREKWAMDIQAQLYMASVAQDGAPRLEGTSFTIAVGITLF